MEPSPELVERAGDLKQELVAYASRFARAFEDFCSGHVGSNGDGRLDERYNLVDRFILEHDLPDGRRVVDLFVASAGARLSEADRAILLGWRDVVEGVFEIRGRDRSALLTTNLVDELDYRMHATAGPSAFDVMRRGDFLIARAAPLADEWMLSGAQTLFRKRDRREMVRLAADLSFRRPSLLYRNPVLLAQAWELQNRDRSLFLEFFGTDLVVLAQAEFPGRMEAHWNWRCQQLRGGHARAAADPPRQAPAPDLPDSLLHADTVGLIYDELEGLVLLAEFGTVQEVFDDPRLLSRREHRRIVSGYLRDDSISPLPFRRLAANDEDKASRVFQGLLNNPRFSWPRDGEALMRRRKSAYFRYAAVPRVFPANRVMLEAAGDRGNALSWRGGGRMSA